MPNLTPYFTFDGNCREAMNFYRDCFKGEITQIQTFAEANMPVDEKMKSHILHAEMRAGEILLMASDGMADFVAQPGNNVSLTVNLTDVKEEERLFAALAAGGKVSMPLQDTFWGARYGMLTDRYGVNWMLNCPK